MMGQGGSEGVKISLITRISLEGQREWADRRITILLVLVMLLNSIMTLSISHIQFLTLILICKKT